MSETVWTRSDDWVGTEVDGSYVMVNVETGKYVSLNETAAAIWQSLEVPLTDAQICEWMTARYDISAAECAVEVADALATMRDLSLVFSSPA